MKYSFSAPAAAVLLCVMALAGCSSNPNAIEPNPLPDFEKRFDVDRLWRSGAGDGVEESAVTLRPAVTAQRVFAADIHGRVYGFDREKGKRQWRAKTGDRISGGLYAGYGQVLYGTREGEAVALDAETGEELWRTPVSSEIMAEPTSNGLLAIFQTIDGHVQALDAETGEQVWDYETTVPNLTLLGGAQPVIESGRVYAGFASGKVAAIELETGAPVWERRVAEPTGRSELDRLVDVDSSLLVENGGVFTATFQGKLAVLDWENGRPYWNKDLSSHQELSSYLGSLFVSDSDGLVRAAEQRSGSFLWQQDKLYGRRLTGTVVQDGLVAVGDFEGYLHWMDADTGELVARYHHDGDPFAGTPVVYDEVLYALSADGKLAAYRLEERD
ncbi:outer membrane protein assembly factor BamB [Alloalcanivorax profundimaris]|uniref:outer membrane protein assembly factor BamB n=1 Tax=Alloalcanivorax profundimaris TaxID=2735259 RepID=UPI00210B0B35|nr:outer membrane protein assembly factor BamB [Alloalcanivorax profundimaris]MCQ6261275.1 outer membrane protein assembly factor BamB [Alcanivorax sp. MM125-6]UWN51251.1 Outer membrane protein assembly factor BamB [Alcanivorax sp. ALC70]